MSELISTYNSGGTAERHESFVPEWMKDFLFLALTLVSVRPSAYSTSEEMRLV